MRRFKYFLPAFVVATVIIHLPYSVGAPQTASQTKYTPVTTYDPKRDAAQDIQDAIKEAKRTNKRILLEVGGEWVFVVSHSGQILRCKS